ncbi:MAG: phosphoribosylamine--glycine ligase [Bacteroidia bacterium]
MNILLIGSGGREHALAWKMAQSSKCERLFIAPGNAGTKSVGENVALPLNDFEAVLSFIQTENIHMVVVGPEQPLVDGLPDFLRKHQIPVIGPNQKGAELEGSKAFAKAFMQKYDIPTAKYATFHANQIQDAITFGQSLSLPLVIKASGLAAGKGVVICEKAEEIVPTIEEMLSGSAFGDAGQTIVIEEFLAGIEMSVFVLTNGEEYVILPTAKDYKRIGEGDIGLNTGGMGAISPVPFATPDLMQKIETEMIQRTLHGLKQENIPFIGFIFLGCMIVKEQSYLLEYNCRMGDPETEAVMPRISSDLVALFEATLNHSLASYNLEISEKHCATVMLVSGGYPNHYEKGKEMTGLEEVENSLLFHAGTAEKGGQLVTSGGRVIAISSLANDLQTAVKQSLNNAEKIQFEGKYYRRDIGRDVFV